MFFLRRTRPLELTAGRMRALRLSLNTPVVATQDLPVGPARAAIAIHAEARGGLAITVGVRSLACGSAVLYGFEGAIRSGLVSEVMDAALSFAESMGFLFEDDRVTLAPAQARRLWGELLDGCARAPGPRSGSAMPAATPGPQPPPTSPEPDAEELWLEEIAPAVQAVSHAVALTKFRRAAAPTPRRPEALAGTPTARRPLGRFRVGLQRKG